MVQHFLKTPPKPHREKPEGKGDKKTGGGRHRADRKKSRGGFVSMSF